MITILVSIIVSLVFESPIVIIEKYIFGPTISTQNKDDCNSEEMQLRTNNGNYKELNESDDTSQKFIQT